MNNLSQLARMGAVCDVYDTADEVHRFSEVNESNNTTWVDLKLTLNTGKKGKGGNRVSIVGYGPLP